ncbi:DsbE family thiol:disulfide interchange protein [Zoogloea sp.]|uniref:DsbE family thiol:disulfide interchange protein n=1 Tax=Zoogloea sp. TaxID=49181 RepID=UPI0035AF8BB5
MKRFLIPLAVFLVLVVFLAVGLKRDPREVPSPLVGKPAPEFRLDTLTPGKQFSPADMRGQVWLLNVWASWCVSCRAEHPLLVAFSKQGGLPIVGLNYKELRGDGEIDMKKVPAGEEPALVRQRAGAWLARHGDPYALSVLDLDGRVGIDYGVYGVPETYLIDRKGIIRFKQIGPITPEALEQKILPLAKQLAGEAP